MHELFLTAIMPSSELTFALKVLQGFCSMQPTHILHRRLTYTGPTRAPLTGLDQNFLSKQPQPQSFLWRQLHELFLRQSYLVTLTYETERSQFSEHHDENGQDLDSLPGTLRWSDWPDPIGGRERAVKEGYDQLKGVAIKEQTKASDLLGVRPMNSRFAINIENEKELISALLTNKHTYLHEGVSESYRFVHGNVVFHLTQYFQLPKHLRGRAAPLSHLPPWEELEMFDPEGKWIVSASVEVLNGRDQDLMRKGTEELLDVKAQLEDVFALLVMHRHLFDTRVRLER